MAFGAKKIFPIDTQPGTAVGVDIPFNAPAVFKPNYTTQASIKNNLINFFLTNKNERYLNPTFGGDLRAFIFQQITEGNTEYLKQDIQSQLSLYFQTCFRIFLLCLCSWYGFRNCPFVSVSCYGKSEEKSYDP
jgi:hypothetical protein